MNRRRVVSVSILVVAVGFLLWLRGCRTGIRLSAVHLPPGFTIALFADRVPNARSLTHGAPGSGTVFVGSREAGAVYALADRDHDGRAESTYVVARGLTSPNGVAFRDGALYVAEIHRITRYDGIESRLADPPAPVMVYDRLPREGHHGWRYIGFGPDGLLYVASGAPCNVCAPPESVYATILRMRPDGSGLEVFAAGVRNSVGFDWHPGSGELWFTDNGRDLMGQDQPADELNHAPRAGMHFGFPFCHEGRIPDPGLAAGRRCEEFTPPEVRLAAHAAALGVRFYTGTMFPPEYRDQAFIAQHGSWNRVIPIGYRLSVVRFGDGQPPQAEVFAEGWLRAGNRQPWGRPVDLLVMPDGAVLVSDDLAGVVYRISYEAP